MERGLLWLPLLAAFFWLAWAGWNEYQKLEVYRQWAESFQRAKYDIYAVLAQKDDQLTWGRSTRKGIIDPKTFSLKDVRAIQLEVNNQTVNLQNPPERGKSVYLQFELPDSTIRVPFTQVDLAAKWGQVLERDRQKLQQPSVDL